MTYIHVTRTRGQSISEYDKVLAALGADPVPGRQSHQVGESDGSLCIVDTWSSRADADRFTSERLFPAFEAAGVHPQADTVIIAFEAVDRG